MRSLLWNRHHVGQAYKWQVLDPYSSDVSWRHLRVVEGIRTSWSPHQVAADAKLTWQVSCGCVAFLGEKKGNEEEVERSKCRYGLLY
jgi:hypothetical protein